MAIAKAILIWSGLAGLVLVPLAVAATSEYLQYRDAVYIAAGFAGVIALALLLVQPLFASGRLPGLPMAAGRTLHRWTGAALVLSVAAHVAGLWVTSPPDMIDALTFMAPTAFSVFGVVAMWAVAFAAGLAMVRKSLRLRPQVWRLAHTASVGTAVAASVAHALLIEGTMGSVSKAVLCAAVVGSLLWTVLALQTWKGLRKARD